MTKRPPVLPASRLEQRLEHFMTEIATPATAAQPTAPPSRPRHHRAGTNGAGWRRLAATGLAVAGITAGVLVIANTTGGPSGNGPAAFAFETVGGNVTVKVIRDDVDAASMNAQLKAHDVPITVDVEPAAPQLVGVLGSASATPDVPASVLAQLGNDSLRKSFTVPAHFPGKITLTFGRPTKPGEKADLFGEVNALAPNGALFCLRLAGTSPETAAETLTARGYTVHYFRGALRQGGPGAQNPRDLLASPPAGSVVAEAAIPAGSFQRWPAGSKDVYLRALSPSSQEFSTFRWMNYSPADQKAGSAVYANCPASH